MKKSVSARAMLVGKNGDMTMISFLSENPVLPNLVVVMSSGINYFLDKAGIKEGDIFDFQIKAEKDLALTQVLETSKELKLG